MTIRKEHKEWIDGASAVPKAIVPPKTKGEMAMDKYDSLFKIIDALEAGDFENTGGSLKNFIPFLALKRMA